MGNQTFKYNGTYTMLECNNVYNLTQNKVYIMHQIPTTLRRRLNSTVALIGICYQEVFLSCS